MKITKPLAILILIIFGSFLVPTSLVIYVVFVAPPLSTNISTWSSLLLAPGIFPAQLDKIEELKYGVFFYPSSILAELTRLLDDPEIMTGLYENYRIQLKKNVESNSNLQQREKIFKKKLLQIAQHNLDFASGKKNWQRGITQFSDLTVQESYEYTGRTVAPNENDPHDPKFLYYPLPPGTAPEYWDWRDHDLVSPVQNQGHCLSSTLFAVTSLLETAIARKTSNKSLLLSNQELLDCFDVGPDEETNRIGNGCQGNYHHWPELILNYIKDKGLLPESEYQTYGEGYSDRCTETEKSGRFYLRGFAQALTTEDTYKDILVQWGLVTVTMSYDAAWFDYRDGYFDEVICSESEYLHTVNLVGYGHGEEGPYWIIKNSWGTLWGLKGYMKIARGSNICRMNNFPVFYITLV